MRRETQGSTPRSQRRAKPSENPLGDETDQSVNHTSSFGSPSTDPNQTNYSGSPRRTARKSTSGYRASNVSSRTPRDMDLTRGVNRNIRASVGPNRTPDRSSRAEPGSSRRPQAARKQPRPRRYKPGTRALMEIRKFQQTVTHLIPKLPFSRVVREILMQNTRFSNQDMRVTKDALLALQEASEIYLVNFFEDAMRMAIHGKRVTLMPKDMQLITFLRNNWGLL